MNALVIYTGGTIGMVKDKSLGVLKPGDVSVISDFLKANYFESSCDLVCMSKVIDSANFNKKYFTELSTLIKQEYHNYDAFLILMGTDTMAYISSLLSFCIEGLSKPIVFTGSQKSLNEKKSDAIANLKGAISGIIDQRFPNEVGIYFAQNWFRAVSTTKVDSKDLDAYTCPNPLQKNSPALDQKEFSVITELSKNVIIVKLSPFDSEAALFALLNQKGVDGIVLEAFGAGNIFSFSKELKQLFKTKIAQGFKIVITSQCLKGGVEIGKYASSLSAQELGFLNAGNMTIEAVVSKLLYLFELKLDIQEFRRFFEDSIRGELS